MLKKYLSLLDSVEKDSKTLSAEEFEQRYKKNPIAIILSSPAICNDSVALFRARLAKTISPNEDLSSPATFSYVPLSMNKIGLPKMGRANYKGQSIFYASERMKTNFKEINKDCSIGEETYVAKWVLKPDSKLHLYHTMPSWGISTTNNQRGIFSISKPEIVNSELGMYLKRIGNIMMSNEEVGKYLASSYIANCIYKASGVVKDSEGNVYYKDLHYDGIAYPSATGKTEEVNIALKPEFVDKNMKLEYVVKGCITSDLRTIDFKEIGINENGKIAWYKAIIDKNSITIKDVKFYDFFGKCIELSKGLIFDANNNIVKLDNFSLMQILLFNADNAFNELSKYSIMNIKEGQIVTKSSLEEGIFLICNRELIGWKYVDGNNSKQINKISYYIRLKPKIVEAFPSQVKCNVNDSSSIPRK